jgi:putative SOS response-associated peptidase YedK
MVMEGLWARWKSSKGEEIISCTIITCPPNDSVGELHNRMPVVLGDADWPKWVGKEPATAEELLAMLRPCSDQWLKIWPVDKRVGNVKNKSNDLADPISAPG